MKPEEEDADPFHIVATSSLTGGTTRVLMHDDSFAVFDRLGDVRTRGLGEQGIYHGGTRFLSSMRLSLGTHDLLFLSSTVLHNNLVLSVDLTNPELTAEGPLAIPHATLHVSRSKLLRSRTCYERLEISNYGATAVDALLSLEFDADFADVFEVRGTKRQRRGERLPTRIDGSSVLMSYRGLDDVVRTTRLDFAPPPQ